MSRYLLLILFQVSFLSGVLKGQIVTRKDGAKSAIAEIDSILNNKVALNEIPGAVIQIKKDGKLFIATLTVMRRNMISITINLIRRRK